MPSAEEIFGEVMKAAEANAAAEAAAKAQTAANTIQPELKSALTEVANHLKASAERERALEARLAAMEGARTRSTQQENDPYATITNDLGITRQHLGPVVQHEVSAAVEAGVNKIFEEKFGPALRNTAAVQSYQEEHPDFDFNRLNTYLAKNPEVRTIVQRAAQKGAYDVGVEYAETRRQVDEKIAAEAGAQARGQKRQESINENRPHAAVIGATGANGENRGANVQRTLSAEQLEKIYAHADANDWKPFEEAFVNPSLPSEEEFQRLAQS